jgi:hypothetical protein
MSTARKSKRKLPEPEHLLVANIAYASNTGLGRFPTLGFPLALYASEWDC